MQTYSEAIACLRRAWPDIVDECRAVLGGETHYQAIVYHCLRTAGAPRTQLGTNVKQWIVDPVTPEFRKLDKAKHADYQGGSEPVPDIVMFGPGVEGDWRRRNHETTLTNMLVAIEVKASERSGGRLRPAEILRDIRKLDAHRTEAFARGAGMKPVMLLIDTASARLEQMTESALAQVRQAASDHELSLLYVSREKEIWDDATCELDADGFFSDHKTVGAVGSMTVEQRLEAIASFFPMFSKMRFEAGEWVAPRRVGDAIQMGCFDFSIESNNFIGAAYKAGWVLDFDWPEWSRSPEAQQLFSDPRALSRASAFDLARLLTWRLRVDRFVEGALAADFEKGLMARIAGRAMALLHAMPGQPKKPMDKREGGETEKRA